MDKDDLLQVIADELEASDERWNELVMLNESTVRFSQEPSWVNMTNFSGSGEILKRRPMRQIHRQREAAKVDEMSSAYLFKNTCPPQEKLCLDVQLNRLQKTLNYSKSGSIYPHFKRQKALIKRLGIANKENQETKKDKEVKNTGGKSITSQFLQEIKGVNEQLYEIYLSLFRFHEQEKEQSQKIGHQIKQVNQEIRQNTAQLQQLKINLLKITSIMQTENQNQTDMEMNFMKDEFTKYFQKLALQ